MNPSHAGVPTLTEVIDVVAEMPADSAPLPLAPESIALDMQEDATMQAAARPRLMSQDALVNALVERLAPRLDAWLEMHANSLLQTTLRAHADEAARALARALSAQLPALAREALDELRRDNSIGGVG